MHFDPPWESWESGQVLKESIKIYNIKYSNNFYLPFSRSEAWLDWNFAESFLRSKKSWITFSKASIFSFESKFSANEFSKSPTNLVTLNKIKYSRVDCFFFQNSQRFVVLLYPAGFSPHRVVTGIVKGADEILYEWNESCWGHCLLLEITCKILAMYD